MCVGTFITTISLNKLIARKLLKSVVGLQAKRSISVTHHRSTVEHN